MPTEVPQARVLIRTKTSLSSGHAENIRYMVYIAPEVYGSGHPDQLDHAEMNKLRHHIAKFNNKMKEKEYMIVAPGRWGDNTESELGVYVTAGDYDRTAGIVEVVGDGHWKDVPPSAGTHDYGLIVERGISTLSMDLRECENDDGSLMAKSSMDSCENSLGKFLEGVPERLAKWIKIIDAEEIGRTETGEKANWRFNIAMNNVEGKQEAVVYLAHEGKDAPLKGSLDDERGDEK